MNDDELVLLARSEKWAQEELLKKYEPLVKSIAVRFFLHGGENEDLRQEGMVGLYSAINSYEAGGANFSTYAYSCIRNAIVDAVKKSAGAKNSALNNFVPIVEIDGAPAPAVSPEDEVIKLENRREFLQKISKSLSSLEFKVTVMYLDGLGVSEIASAVDKSQKSVSNALSRAKSKLEKLYL